MIQSGYKRYRKNIACYWQHTLFRSILSRESMVWRSALKILVSTFKKLQEEEEAGLVEYVVLILMIASMVVMLGLFAGAIQELMEASACKMNMASMTAQMQSGSGIIHNPTNSCPSGGVYTVQDGMVYCSVHTKNAPTEGPEVPYLWNGRMHCDRW